VPPARVLTCPADVVKFLVATGEPALLNAVNDAGNTALHWAALNGHLESVKMLIAAGADITIFNKAGHDAVFEAEINDKKDVVDWLLGHVEGLEKSIGGAAGGDGEEEMTFRAGDTSGVEGVTEGVQGLDTKDG
jgi:ankyrin repeat protein